MFGVVRTVDVWKCMARECVWLLMETVYILTIIMSINHKDRWLDEVVCLFLLGLLSNVPGA